MADFAREYAARGRARGQVQAVGVPRSTDPLANPARNLERRSDLEKYLREYRDRCVGRHAGLAGTTPTIVVPCAIRTGP